MTLVESTPPAAPPAAPPAMFTRWCLSCFAAMLLIALVLFTVPHPAWVGRALYWLFIASMTGAVASAAGLVVSGVILTRVFMSEWMIILLVSSTPAALLIGSANDLLNANDAPGAAISACLAVIVFLVNLGGALWGIRVCNRINEDRTWQRLKFVAVGWVLVTALVHLPGVFLIRKTLNGVEPDGVWFALLMAANLLALLAGWLIERRVRQHAVKS